MSTEFYRKSTPVARKTHRCGLCLGAVDIGAPYTRVVGKVSGYDLFNEAYHDGCNELVERYLHAYPGEEFDEDGVRDDIHDRVCSGCPQEDGCPHGAISFVRTCDRVAETYRL